jgi:hypothetical protein
MASIDSLTDDGRRFVSDYHIATLAALRADIRTLYSVVSTSRADRVSSAVGGGGCATVSLMLF